MDPEKTSYLYFKFIIYILIFSGKMVQTGAASFYTVTEHAINTEKTTFISRYPGAAKNLTGDVFWDIKYNMFRLNLTWQPPSNFDKLLAYTLTYACDPSPCKTNFVSEVETLLKDRTSIILPNIEEKPNAVDFISLDSNIQVILQSFPSTEMKNNNATLLFKVPPCVNDRCNCRHMNKLPKPKVETFMNYNNQINVTWWTPYKILEKNDSRYSIINTYISLCHIKYIRNNSCKLIDNTTVSLRLEEINVVHWTLLNITAPIITDNYRIILYLADNEGCRSPKTVTNVSKYDLNHNHLSDNGYIMYSYLTYSSITFCILLITGLITWSVIRRRKYCIEYLCKKSSKRRRTQLNQLNSSRYSQLLKLNHISIAMGENVVYISQDTKEAINKTNNDMFEIDYKYLQFLNQIGRGEFGVVFKAYLRMPSSSESATVAVKTLTNIAALDEMTEFTKEIKMLKHVGYHPNIIQLIGYCTKQEPYCMIMEYLENGDLRTYLRKLKADFLKNVQNKIYYVQPLNKKSTRFNFSRTEIDKIGRYSIGSTNSTLASESTYGSGRPSTETEYILLSNDGSPETPISVFGTPKEIVEPSINHEELQKFALQIAQGMAHLEKKNIVHRDLAARNILIDNDKNLKISDFGLSRKGTYICTKSKLPFRWLSIEALQNQIFSNKSDVWSFGIVLWEIGTLGDCPYSKMENYLQILKFLIEGHRLEKPTTLDNEIYELMLKCWTESQDARPSFEELVDILQSMNQRKTYITFENIKNGFFAQTLVNEDAGKCVN